MGNHRQTWPRTSKILFGNRRESTPGTTLTSSTPHTGVTSAQIGVDGTAKLSKQVWPKQLSSVHRNVGLGIQEIQQICASARIPISSFSRERTGDSRSSIRFWDSVHLWKTNRPREGPGWKNRHSQGRRAWDDPTKI